MTPEQYPEYVARVLATQEKFAGRLDVRLGLESDFYPGVEPWLEELHGRVPLSHILGSIHYQVMDYRRKFYTGNIFSYQGLYFDHLALSAESGLFDTLAHPDLIKNESPADWDFELLREGIARSLDRIAKTGVAMELNTSGVQKAVKEMNPSPSQLMMMAERGIPVVIGADAHVPHRVGDGYETALRLLEACGYQEVSYFIDRKRHNIPIHAALASLGPIS